MTDVTIQGGVIYNLDGAYQRSSTQTYDRTFTLSSVAINGLEIIECSKLSRVGKNSSSKKGLNGNKIAEAKMDISFKKMDVTPDFQKALVWNSSSVVKIFDLNNMTLLHTFVPSKLAPNKLTQRITFKA